MRNVCVHCCSIRGLLIITSALVVVLIGILVLSFVGIPSIEDSIIASSVRLENHTIQWDRFIDLPIPIIMKVYLYEVLNAADVMERGATPKLQEVGPYVWRQTITKEELDYDDSEDSVDYYKRISVEFDQELSGNRTLNDTLVVANPVLLGLSQTTSSIEQIVVAGCLDQIFPPGFNTLFINATVGDLAFNGITFAEASEDMGPACNLVRNQVIEKTRPMRNIERVPFQDDPDVVQHLKFTYFNFKVREPDGRYTLNRGIKDITQLGTIMRWNNAKETKYWGRTQSTNNETCKRVRGGDSTLYPPQVNKENSFEIFSTDICRTVKISYTGERTYEGITGYLFEPSNDTFRPATLNSENDCYCIQKTLDPHGAATCYLDGVLDVQACFASPLLLSFPHFLHADEKYINDVEGVSTPDKDTHGIYLLIEPNTGTPLQGRKRVQLNIVLRRVKYLSFTANLPQVVLPMLWLEEGADLTEDLLDEIRKKFFNTIKMVNGLKYALIAISAASVVVVSVILVRKKMFNLKK